MERFLFGFIGGVGGAVITMPIDVTKSIAQKQQGLETKSSLQIVKDVLRTRGVRGLYTGLMPRLGRVGLDRAFGFLGAFPSHLDLHISHKPISNPFPLLQAFEWTVEHLQRARYFAK